MTMWDNDDFAQEAYLQALERGKNLDDVGVGDIRTVKYHLFMHHKDRRTDDNTPMSVRQEAYRDWLYHTDWDLTFDLMRLSKELTPDENHLVFDSTGGEREERIARLSAMRKARRFMKGWEGYRFPYQGLPESLKKEDPGPRYGNGQEDDPEWVGYFMPDAGTSVSASDYSERRDREEIFGARKAEMVFVQWWCNKLQKFPPIGRKRDDD